MNDTMAAAESVWAIIMGYGSYVWEWPDRSGLEHLQLFTAAEGIKAQGLVVARTTRGVIGLKRVICFRYSIALGPDWRVLRCGVFLPAKITKMLSLSLDREGHWTTIDQKLRADLEGCVAVDIMDTPFTKTPIVSSLNLEEGQSATIKVAHFDYRCLVVRPVEEEWERLATARLGVRRYRCKVLGTAVEMELDEQLIVQWSRWRWRLVSRPGLFASVDEQSIGGHPWVPRSSHLADRQPVEPIGS
jgi:hypothetical protein